MQRQTSKQASGEGGQALCGWVLIVKANGGVRDVLTAVVISCDTPQALKKNNTAQWRGDLAWSGINPYCGDPVGAWLCPVWRRLPRMLGMCWANRSARQEHHWRGDSTCDALGWEPCCTMSDFANWREQGMASCMACDRKGSLVVLCGHSRLWPGFRQVSDSSRTCRSSISAYRTARLRCHSSDPGQVPLQKWLHFWDPPDLVI